MIGYCCRHIAGTEAGALLFDQTAGTGQNADLWGFCPAPKCERPIPVGGVHRGPCEVGYLRPPRVIIRKDRHLVVSGLWSRLRATLLRGVSLSWPPEPVRLRSNVTVGGTGVHAEGVLPIWGHQTVWTSNDCSAGGVWEQQIEARLWSRDRTGCCAHSRAW
jgi:hypothetical protein